MKKIVYIATYVESYMMDNDYRSTIGAYDESGLQKLFEVIGCHPDVVKEKIAELKKHGGTTCGFRMCATITVHKEVLNSEYDLDKFKTDD